jgi:hypothetical protein
MIMDLEKELLVFKIKGYELQQRRWAGDEYRTWFKDINLDYHQSMTLLDSTYRKNHDRDVCVQRSIQGLKEWIAWTSKNSN